MPKAYSVGGRRVELGSGTITDYRASALVLPANPLLQSDRGWPIQRAFINAAGEEIFEDAERLARIYGMVEGRQVYVEPGSALATGSGRLGRNGIVRSVVHAVSCRIAGTYFITDAEIIRSSVRSSLMLCDAMRLKSVGFPAIGSGLGALSLESSARAILDETKKHMAGKTSLEYVGLILFGEGEYKRAEAVADDIFK